MKKGAGLLVLLLVVASGLWAQQGQSQTQPQSKSAEKQAKPVDSADVEAPNRAQAAKGTPRVGHPLNGQPAPKLGHPLDPADVDVLTGKANGDARSRYRGYVTPYVYPDYSVGGSEFGGSLFAPVSTATSPFPFAFGRFGRRNFFFVGGQFVPRALFFSRGRAFFILP